MDIDEFQKLSALYNEVLKNLSWYQLNSDFKDPMYQYMSKLKNDLFVNVISPSLKSNYTAHVDFVVYDKSVLLRFGNYQCFRPEKEAYWDTVFSCALFQLPFFLENIQIGYIGFVFIIPIMLISIFGGIKESYKWFILSQAIWDAFLCYDYICSKPTLLGWSDINIYTKQNTCFYRNAGDNSNFMYLVFQAFRIFLRNASFIPIFHLAFSRFLAMYFPQFYKTFSKNGYKIAIFIIIFNVICVVIFGVSKTSSVANAYTIQKESEKCMAFCPAEFSPNYCNENFPKFFQCRNGVALNFTATINNQQKFAKIFRFISYSIPPTMFFLSIICAGFLFWKISSQLKFQLKTNPDSFKQTIKISTVVGFQCLTMSVIFVITGIQKYMQIKAEAVGTYKVYDDLPAWLLLLQYYTTTASLNMIRILLDSCIILSVLTGYSSCVISTFKFLYLCFTNPKKAFNKLKHNITSTEVTVLSMSRK